jgi:hypothetical protein
MGAWISGLAASRIGVYGAAFMSLFFAIASLLLANYALAEFKEQASQESRGYATAARWMSLVMIVLWTVALVFAVLRRSMT